MAFLSKSSSVIGIDIGSSSVKFLQLNKSKSGQWSLAAFGKEDLPPEAIVDGSVSSNDLMSDIHASAEYRAHLIGEMTRRAVVACE